MKFLVSALIDNKYAGEIWQKSLEQKSVTKSRSKLEFALRQNELPLVEFSVQVIPVFACS